MLLNRLEFALMNNPARAAMQRHVEARQLVRMGGDVRGGTALEIGCGRGVGIETIIDTFGAARVDAFDLDPRMVRRAHDRLARRGRRVRLWVGDASAIAAASGTYDAVIDYGIIHHVPEWRRAVEEVFRVLKPGGRFYAEEMLAGFITHPVARLFFEHPQHDRFTAAAFLAALEEAGFDEREHRSLGRSFAWFVARKPLTVPAPAPAPAAASAG